MKAIDSRAPLRGGYVAGSERDEAGADLSGYESPQSPASLSPRHRRLPSISSNPPSPLGPQRAETSSDYYQHSPSSPNGTNPAMIRSRADVDDALRRMTESFRVGFGSLEGGLRSRRLRTESAAAALNPESCLNTVQRSRGSPLLEEGGGSSGRENASSAFGIGRSCGMRALSSANMSSSSLFAGGHRSYDSGEQIVGRMDLTEEDDNGRNGGRSRSPQQSGRVAQRRDVEDALQDAPFARTSRTSRG